LLHGTTRQRAESIEQNGPDANFREPAGDTADGFSTCIAQGPFDLASPDDYARRKAALFPNEGGAAILTFELPDDLADSLVGGIGEIVSGKALNVGSEIRFEPGGGLEQLRAIWPRLTITVATI
jgi:hypothetical protein